MNEGNAPIQSLVPLVHVIPCLLSRRGDTCKGCSKGFSFSGLVLEQLVCLLDSVLEKSSAFVSVDLHRGIELGQAVIRLGLLGQFLLNPQVNLFLVILLLVLQDGDILPPDLDDGLQSLLLGLPSSALTHDHLVGFLGQVGLGRLGGLNIIASLGYVGLQPSPFALLLFLAQGGSFLTGSLVGCDETVVLPLLALEAHDFLLIAFHLLKGLLESLRKVAVDTGRGNANQKSDRNYQIGPQRLVAGLPLTIEEGGRDELAELEARGHHDNRDGEGTNRPEGQRDSPNAKICRAPCDE